MKQKTKWITPSEYAENNFSRLGKPYTLQGITKMLREKRLPNGVLNVKKFSRFYLLEVSA